MKKVIGLVAKKGSGKGTFAKLFQDFAPEMNIRQARFSDVLNVVLKELKLPSTRENLQKLAVVVDKTYGEGTFSNAVYHRVKDDNADVVILDGVRWDTDVEIIRRFPQNCLVYITTSSDEERHRRTVARNEKAGEAETTFEQFMSEELAPNEVLIPKIGATADFVIDNSGTMEDFRQQVGEFHKRFISNGNV